MTSFFRKISHSKSKSNFGPSAPPPPTTSIPTPPQSSKKDKQFSRSTSNPRSTPDTPDTPETVDNTLPIPKLENFKNFSSGGSADSSEDQQHLQFPIVEQRSQTDSEKLPNVSASPAHETSTQNNLTPAHHSPGTIANTKIVTPNTFNTFPSQTNNTPPSNLNSLQMPALLQKSTPKSKPPKNLSLPSTPTQPIESPANIVSSNTPWTKKKLYNSPFPRYGHTISSQTSSTGSIYMMGGLSGSEVYGDMWVIEQIRPNDLPNMPNNLDSSTYPYISSQIENFQKIPSPRIGHASILIGNAFIIFGGDTAINEEQSLSLDNQLYFFNISSLKWTITSPKGERPCGRYGTQISVLNFETKPNFWLSQLFVFGGQLNNDYFNDLWKFDLSNFKNPDNRWVKIEPKGDIPPPLTDHSMTSFNDKIYIYGGHNDKIVNDKLYCFDSNQNEWKICNFVGPTCLPGLYSHSTAIHGSLLFIYGGKLLNDEMSNDLFIIDLSTFNSWKLESNLPLSPNSKYGHSISVNTSEEKLLITGGDLNDEDFTGIENTSINLIDESKFEQSSSIIYECDITQISKFIGKSKSKSKSKSQINPKIKSNEKSPNAFPTSFNKDLIDSKNSKSNIDISDSPLLNHDEERNHGNNDVVLNANIPFASSTPIKKVQSIELVDINHDDTLNNTLDSTDRVMIPRIGSKSPSALHKNAVKLEATPETSTNPIANNIIYKTPEEDTEFATKFHKAPDSIEHKKTVISTPTFTTPVLQHTSQLPFSPAVSEKDNQKLQQLIKMVSDIKLEMRTSVSAANSQIVQLENEKADLLIQLRNKSTVIDPSIVAGIDDDKDVPLSIRYEKMKNFITIELSTVAELQQLVNSREEKIKELREQIKGEDVLSEKIEELTNQNSTLKSKLVNFETEESTKDTKNLELFNIKLDSLVEKWSIDGPHTNTNINETDIKTLQQKHIESTQENEILQSKVREYELIFADSKKSLSNAYQALALSQAENETLKGQFSNVSKELDELKLKKRVYSNSNIRTSTPTLKHESSGNDILTNSRVNEGDENEENEECEENDVSLIDERYEIKIRDLEANVYIVSQERDQLRNELNNLKKELYNLQNK